MGSEDIHQVLRPRGRPWLLSIILSPTLYLPFKDSRVRIELFYGA